MNKRKSTSNAVKMVYSCIFSACAVLLAVFAFADLAVAEAVYCPDTKFGWFFDVFSPCIAPAVGLFLLGALSMSGRGSNAPHPAVRAAELVFAAICAVIAVYEFDHYAGWRIVPWLFALTVALLLALALLIGSLLHPDRAQLQQLTVCAVGMILFVFLFVYVVKIIWGRQRFVTMEVPAAQFTCWLFPQGGGTTEAFRSFPSGHTANGCAILLLLLFARAFPALRRVQPLLVVLAAVWIPLMAFSRMVEGMHFGSDVTMGFTIAFGTFAIIASPRFARRISAFARHL